MVIKLKKKIEEVPEITKPNIDRKKLGKRSKVKGADFERKVAEKFKKVYGIELKRTPQSGGFAKKSEKADDFRGDIIVVDKDTDLKLHIECKNQKTWSVPAWIRQATEDCPRGKTPVVIAHQHGTSKDFAILPLDDLLKLLPKDTIFTKKGGK